jgi:small neutral amino acid transporter SnatA (MarC family)
LGIAMLGKPANQTFYKGKLYRLTSAAFGSLLLGAGFYAIFFAETQAAVRITGGIALILLGYNTVWSAYKAKESWLSKIGPLP